MGGVITVESRQGSGSLFTVEIPYERPSADILSASGSEKTEKPHKDLRGRHVLLVEDNIMNREIAETILSDAGADITDAVDGREALEIFRKSAPGEFDLVIMNGVNGMFSTKDFGDYTNINKKKRLLIRIANSRTYSIGIAALGYNTITIPWSDTYTSMQTGVMDGMFNIDIFRIEDRRRTCRSQ